MSQAVVEVGAGQRSGVALSGVVRTLGGRPVLDGVDLRVPPKGRLGIVGRSGVGKSTLLSLVAGLDEPDQGVVSIWGETTAPARLACCALMPQRDCLLPWRTALDNAILALENHGIPRDEARRRAEPLFERLGLAGAEQLRPAQLSSGMRQRIAFIRTLLAGKPVLLLDEPFGALDAITRAELQEWLVSVLDSESSAPNRAPLQEGRAGSAGQPSTVLLVTHDVEEALLLCDTVAVLADGGIAVELAVDVDREGPRREVVTRPEFVELRERALEAIG